MSTNLKWYQQEVVYQIYPRSFKDSNGDGIGDIQGIISKLDYLKELGVGIIWLSPVYKSPNDDNGYDISDYKDIHPDFGTMSDMDELISEAKKRNIRIIMDLVINHTSDEHPWFVKSKDPNSPYRDYYYWVNKKDMKNPKKKPNNWSGFFSGTVWEDTGDAYYLHLFSPKQPDLNWHNPKVMEEIKDVLKFWLDKGISGFRCDVINVIYKNTLENGRKRLVLTGLEHYHSTKGCHEILKTLRREVFDKYDCFTVGETVLVDTKMANDLCSKERKELDMVFGFEHIDTDHINNKWIKVKFKPKKLMKVLARWQNEVNWNANYFENHDQPRSIGRFVTDDPKYHDLGAKMLATILFSLRGTPYIYEGQEIGMSHTTFNSLNEYQDVETHRIYDLATKKLHLPKKLVMKMLDKASRDQARTPVAWNRDGGFTSGTPWLKMNENMKEYNAEDELKNKDSIFYYYQDLIKLRKNNEVLLSGDFKLISTKKNVFIFKRSLDNKVVYVITNMSTKPCKTQVNFKGIVLKTNYDRTKIEVGKIELRPYEALIIEGEN